MEVNLLTGLALHVVDQDFICSESPFEQVHMKMEYIKTMWYPRGAIKLHHREKVSREFLPSKGIVNIYNFHAAWWDIVEG